MIKKILTVVLILLVLTGCVSDAKTFYNDLDEAVESAINATIEDYNYNNCTKTYYSYYLPKSIGKIDGDEISNKFNIDGNIASLSLDITAIVNDAIIVGGVDSLRNIGSVKNPLFTRSGRYLNSSNETVLFDISVSETKDGYFILIQTSEFIFISLANKGGCSNTVHDMLILLRSCKVEKKKLILDYASDTLVSYTTSIITLFESVVPETGYFVDYIDDWKDDKTFIIIDLTENEAVEPGEEENDEQFDPNQNNLEEGE
ncbi:MAG TPA: hypothetical protein PLI19_04990 [Erysipelotrichaceae bacterium]|nr:hypothetical protein [Erysipelotrichaceae bacterium]